MRFRTRRPSRSSIAWRSVQVSATRTACRSRTSSCSASSYSRLIASHRRRPAGPMPSGAGSGVLLEVISPSPLVRRNYLATGEVLFFAGSGNDEDRWAAHQFRSRVWEYPSAILDAPETPIDLFCCGQAFLPDGRLLAA